MAILPQFFLLIGSCSSFKSQYKMTTDRLNFNLIWAIKEGNLDDIKKKVDSCDEINYKEGASYV